jgi:tellurite resistance protein TehA-like permease
MRNVAELLLASMREHKQKVDTMTAAWLLPIVATIVAASSGGIVASILPNSEDQLITLLVSYVLSGTGVPLAMCVIVIYLLRLTTVSLPPKAVIVSSFLPLGPLGHGSFGIMQLGKIAREVFPKQQTLPTVGNAGDILYVFGFRIDITMWGFGLVWLTFVVATINHSRRFPFNMGWWDFTFPLGVFTTATTMLAAELPSAFFRILGTIFSIVVTLLWIVVSMGTMRHVWTGDIFFAPCLKNVPSSLLLPKKKDDNATEGSSTDSNPA